MTLKDELLALRDQDGIINPRKGVAWARRNPGSILYQKLEWNDAEAGEEYRVWQVRRLVAVYVVDTTGARTTISLIRDRVPGGGYRDVNNVMSYQDMRMEALAEALAEFKRIETKYRHLTDLAEIFEAIDDADARYAAAMRRTA